MVIEDKIRGEGDIKDKNEKETYANTAYQFFVEAQALPDVFYENKLGRKGYNKAKKNIGMNGHSPLEKPSVSVMGNKVSVEYGSSMVDLLDDVAGTDFYKEEIIPQAQEMMKKTGIDHLELKYRGNKDTLLLSPDAQGGEVTHLFTPAIYNDANKANYN
ncbi:MAG: hypothetical protein ACQEP1_06270 [Nanobdellota archaeon]